MEGVGKLAFVIFSVFVLMNFADGAIDKWKYDTGTAGTTLTHTKTLAEDATTIVTVLATTDAGSSITVVHTIGTQPNAGQFQIDGSSGVITLGTGKTLDYESGPSLVIQVVATESGGSPPGSATATITLTITDVKEVPVFTMPSGASVSIAANEAGAVGSTVYTVAATDDDAGETITYSIDSGNTNTDFAIGSSTGVITIAKTLVRSTTQTYDLVVHATDSGTPAKTATATINVVVWDFSCSNGSGNVKASMFALVLAAVCSFAKLM